jgi:hypothetical protein
VAIQSAWAQNFDITTNQVESNIVIDVQADIHAPIELVWTVLNDYDHSACFIQSLASSHASPLGPDEWLVERVGILDLGLFNLHLAAQYRVHLEPQQHQLQSQLIAGDAKSMNHALQLTALGPERTELRSHAVIEPMAWFPRRWSQALMLKQARTAFQDMLNEIQKRASTHEASVCPKS